MFIQNLKKKRIFTLLILSIIFFVVAIVLSKNSNTEENQKGEVKKFEEALHKKEKRLDGLISELSKNRWLESEKGNRSVISSNYENLYENEGFVMLVYKNDSLLYWSSNAIPVTHLWDKNVFNLKIGHFENGWYEIRKREVNSIKTVGLLLIKHDFKYQNDYLINNFQDDFKLYSNTSVNKEKGAFNIYTKDNEFLCSLNFSKEVIISDQRIMLLFILYFTGFLVLIIALYYVYISFKPLITRPKLFIIVFSLDLLLIRFIIFYFRIPNVLYESKLFSPHYYGTSWLLPSLGDFVINVIILLILSYILFFHLKKEELTIKRPKILRQTGVFLLFLHVFIFYHILISAIRGLIIDSTISFNLNNIFSLSSYSILGFIIIAALAVSYFLISYTLLNRAYYLSKGLKQFFIFLVISFLVFGAYFTCFHEWSYVYIIILLVFLISYLFIRDKITIFFNVSSICFYVLLFSLLSTYSLHENRNVKEKEKRKLIASKLSVEGDKIAEFKFQNIETRVYSDTILTKQLQKKPFGENEEKLARDYILKTYFDEYWSKYDFQITICNQDDSLDIEAENYVTNCNDYFAGLVRNIGELTVSKNLYLLNYRSGSISYLGILSSFETTDDSLFSTKVYLEIFSTNVSKGLGYPELLINKDLNINFDLSNYSYAIYSDGKLVKHDGMYFYSINLANYGIFKKDNVFFDRNEFNHLYYRVNSKINLIISKKNESFLDIIAPFSYLFIFFGVFVLIVLLVVNWSIKFSKAHLNFRNRLQISMIAVVLASFLIIGFTTLIYIVRLNDNKNIDILSEKTHSVLIELEHKLANEEKITPEIADYLSSLLIKFSLVFFSDINVYDLDGSIIASSRPQIFEEGLISNKMNTHAYDALAYKKKSLFIHNENIGNYNYLSAYVPFRNDQNIMIAYLNLPYFAKQDELKNEISTFLIAFINIYVILIAIAVFLALLISNYITRPLKIIMEKISHVKLGKPNEKIEWERQDEIGNLIIEYNRMIDELSKSAEKLAKSERESAWREMAKQVAHEIKNPLTPMKLNVQYLQKAWNEKAKGWDDRLERFSKTIIEQIDSLSTIATEFSDFAKMPQTKNEQIELKEIISNACELYKDFDNIVISFNTDEEKDYLVLADKKQLLRVFNNMIKNSIQAIGSKKEGIIDISINTKRNIHIIKLKDNGSGISKDQSDRIFSPNFTTKTGGMGLGLAMVKSIVVTAGGKIWFDSEEENGTVFYIELPVYPEN